MTTEELERQIASVLHSLREHVGDGIDAARMHAVGLAHYESLHRDATINDFIPLLVYRYAKEELSQIRRDDLHHAA